MVQLWLYSESTMSQQYTGCKGVIQFFVLFIHAQIAGKKPGSGLKVEKYCENLFSKLSFDT
jgi:hypothetical protein